MESHGFARARAIEVSRFSAGSRFREGEAPAELHGRWPLRREHFDRIVPRYSEQRLPLSVPWRTARWSRAIALVGVLLATAAPADAQDPGGHAPVDALLRLVPSDAAVVLTVEDLREQLHAFTSSSLFAGLKQLPAVQAWLESDKARQLRRSRDQIETVLGIKLSEICDDLIGDAVVLALRLPPAAPADPSQARGLLIFQARNHALLERMIQAVNDKQKAGGELARLTGREHRGTAYQMREFPPGASRPSEWYVSYPDGTFAFSNSESLIQSVIDRKGQNLPRGTTPHARNGGNLAATLDGGLNDLARFQAVRRRQNAKALARLFIEPRQVERLIAASPRPGKASDARIMEMLERYLKAVEYAGATLEWNDAGIVIHTVETLDRSKLEPWLVRWAGNQLQVDPTLARVPSTAIALASGHLDAPAFYEALCQIVPAEDRTKLTNLETLFGGLLLGQDLRTRILPQLGPGVIAYLESPPDEPPNAGVSATATPEAASSPSVFAGVLVTSLRKSSGLRPDAVPSASQVTAAAAIENALHTVLALAALDEKRTNKGSQIITRPFAGVYVTTLSPPTPFAYALDDARSRLILSTSPEAVARYLEAASKPEAGARFRQFRARAFPDAQTFFCVDLSALSSLAGRRHEQLVELLGTRKNRPAAEVERDLAQVVALARLFDAAFLTSRFEPEAAAVHRRAGLILRESKTPKSP
jgi:hypothetical protein